MVKFSPGAKSVITLLELVTSGNPLTEKTASEPWLLTVTRLAARLFSSLSVVAPVSVAVKVRW